jgi:hypothetical protein
LDSFGSTNHNRKFERLSDFGRCGGLMKIAQPRVNMCLPPLAWQTFDVDFIAARKNGEGKITAPEMITIRHNEVVVFDKFVLRPVPPGRDIQTSRSGRPGARLLQGHGTPVRFRNIWVLETEKS